MIPGNSKAREFKMELPYFRIVPGAGSGLNARSCLYAFSSFGEPSPLFWKATFVFSAIYIWRADCIYKERTHLKRAPMLRIDRTANGTTVYFRLSGRIGTEELPELEAQIKLETEKHIVLDLKDVVLLDLNAVKSLDRFEADKIELTNAPVYIRAWIESERDRLRAERDEIGPSNKKFN
jgi:hypothetical protein